MLTSRFPPGSGADDPAVPRDTDSSLPSAAGMQIDDPQTVRGSGPLRAGTDFEHHGPHLARHEQVTGHRVKGDSIQHLVG